MDKIKSERIHFRISSSRKSKLGDYRYNFSKNSHSISVNIDLAEIQFLVTFIHELAHKKCFEIYSSRVASHGKEWKMIFAELLQQARCDLILTQDWDDVLLKNIQNPKATFTKLEKSSEDSILVLDLANESKFELKNGRRFQLIKKRRTRYLCADLNNGQLYTVLGLTPIKRLIQY